MKNFDQWNRQKKYLHLQKKQRFFRERDIFYAALGTNIGFEQDGKGGQFLRPIVILKKFSNSVFIAIPLTRTSKTGKFYFQFSFLREQESVAILSQMRLLDAKRLSHKIGRISKEDFAKLYKKTSELVRPTGL